MNYWMNCSYKQDDIMQKQKFDKKEPDLVEIDRLFTSIKINHSSQKLRDIASEITQPLKQINEFQAKIATIKNPLKQINELQFRMSEITQPLKQINEFQAKIAKITQPLKQAKLITTIPTLPILNKIRNKLK